MRKKDWLESLEAVIVFAVPLVIMTSLYASGVLTEVSGHYISYSIYIVCTVALTRYNGRSWADIGLTRRRLLVSAGMSAVLTGAHIVRKAVFGDLVVSAEVGSWVAVANGLLFWGFSGFGQEILFRGLILFSFLRWKGWKVALVASSVLFGLMHVRLGIAAVAGTMFVGLYWGWVAVETRNIVGISVVHSLHNFLFNFVLPS